MPEDTIKDFDAVIAAKREAAGLGPAFKLNGVTFRCIPIPKATALAELVEATTSNQIQPVIDYMRSLVLPDQRAALDEALASDDNVVGLETLQDILAYCGEKYNALPTSQSSV